MTRHFGTLVDAICLGALAWIASPAAAQPTREERVVIEYVKPVEPPHNGAL